MPIEYHGIKIFHILILFNYGIIINSLSDLQFSTNLCTNQTLNNLSFGVIHSLNFYSGQSQPPNTSCSWIITNSQLSTRSNYILSIRVIELENDPTHWSNELSFWTGVKEISIDDINKTSFMISSSSIQIYFRTRAPLLQTFNPYIRTNLRIRRFLIEFIQFNNDLILNPPNNYFQCTTNKILISKQWKCNCLSECLNDDHSDETDCPLCSMYEPSNSLLCQSNEIWCLPSPSKSFNENLTDIEYDEDDWMQSHIAYSRKIDPKGVCIPQNEYQQCSYSTNKSNCEKILAWRRDHGEIILDTYLLNKYQSLCFVIIAKEEYKIKLILNQVQFLQQRSDLELIIYDGSEYQNRILASSNWLLKTDTIQTRENHIATIVIRKHSNQINDEQHIDHDVLGYLEMNETNKIRLHRRDANLTLLNITWFTSICPDDQILCGGHFETKCYTKEERCDGIWDCISGDDELGCSPESCPTTFACNDRLRLPSDQPRCFTWSERCDGNAICTNRTDEKLCTNWWCNSNNGTFLCKNLNCIYETWVCDGADDCGDHSDEKNCPSRIPRRIVTAAVIGATVCSTLFIIALGCTCKLFHLRTAERRATSRLLNPQRYIEQRREQYQREQQRRLSRQNRQQTSATTAVENSSTISNETRRIAPPSYNQTMGLVDENEERQAALAEHLRLAGLANYITLPTINNNSRASRSTSRHRHRRHRRHRHHHHHRRAHSEGSRVALLEPNVVIPNNAFPVPSTPFSLNRFNRFRSQLRSLFTTNRTPLVTNHNDNNNSIQTNSLSNQFNIYERHHPPVPTPIQPIVLTARPYLNSDFIQPRELPPPYTEEQLASSNPTVNSLSTTIINSRRSSSGGSDIELTNPATTTHRIRKRQVPINTLRDRMRQFISGTTIRPTTDDLNHPMQPTTTRLGIDFEEQPTVVSIEDDEQPSSDDDKMLTP